MVILLQPQHPRCLRTPLPLMSPKAMTLSICVLAKVGGVALSAHTHMQEEEYENLFWRPYGHLYECCTFQNFPLYIPISWQLVVSLLAWWDIWTLSASSHVQVQHVRTGYEQCGAQHPLHCGGGVKCPAPIPGCTATTWSWWVTIDINLQEIFTYW